MKKNYYLVLLFFLYYSCKYVEINRIVKLETLRVKYFNNSIIGSGKFIDLPEKGVVDYGFCYSNYKNEPTVLDNKISLGYNDSIKEFSAVLKNLDLGNHYYRAYANDGAKIYYGEIFYIQTSNNDINIFLDTVNIRSKNNITLKGSISNVGSINIPEHGFCWDFKPNPTVYNSYTNLGKYTSDSLFLFLSNNFISDSLYYVKSYFKYSNNNYVYSNDKILNLRPVKIITIGSELINSSTIKLTGNFDNLGVDTIQEFGFCYSNTSSFPTVNDSKLICQNAQIGNFSNSILNVASSTYYFRAYAIVKNNVIYGQVKSIII